MPAHNFNDLTNCRFGRLVVVARAANNKGGKARWLCRCDCGNEKEILAGSLGKNTFSCGCIQREATAASNVTRMKHGHARGHKPSPEWRSWKAMTDRCNLPTSPNYHLYGGRGISICEQWQGKQGFQQFLADLGKRPKGTSLDRIDTDGNYEPGNCRWSDAKTQSKNRRNTPEYAAIRRRTLDEGRRKMWADPEIRERLLESRRKAKKGA